MSIISILLLQHYFSIARNVYFLQAIVTFMSTIVGFISLEERQIMSSWCLAIRTYVHRLNTIGTYVKIIKIDIWPNIFDIKVTVDWRNLTDACNTKINILLIQVFCMIYFIKRTSRPDFQSSNNNYYLYKNLQTSKLIKVVLTSYYTFMS